MKYFPLGNSGINYFEELSSNSDFINRAACLLPADRFCTGYIVCYQTIKKHFKAEPLKATMLAVALPGAGQIYNRKFWKIPVVYAGFGVLFYTAGFNSKNYNLYIQAYQDFTDVIPETDSYMELIPDDPANYDPVLYPETYDPSTASYYEDGLLENGGLL